jgi:hypothetical protein
VCNADATWPLGKCSATDLAAANVAKLAAWVATASHGDGDGDGADSSNGTPASGGLVAGVIIGIVVGVLVAVLVMKRKENPEPGEKSQAAAARSASVVDKTDGAPASIENPMYNELAGPAKGGNPLYDEGVGGDVDMYAVVGDGNGGGGHAEAGYMAPTPLDADATYGQLYDSQTTAGNVSGPVYDESAAYALAAGGEDATYALAAGGEDATYALAAGGEDAAYELAAGGEDTAYELAAGGEDAAYALAAGGEDTAYELAAGTSTDVLYEVTDGSEYLAIQTLDNGDGDGDGDGDDFV